MGLAIWHYTIFVPDRFWGGIVGALLGSLAGAVIVGFLINLIANSALRVPGEKETNIGVVLYAVPGSLLGMAVIYWLGTRREQDHPAIAE
jgi:ABC-type Fe3+ transport system permease subunit